MNRTGQKIEGRSMTPAVGHATVREAMCPQVFTCPADAPLRDVARTMASEHVHAVIVAGAGTGGRDWGIASDMDLIRAAREEIDERTASWAAASEFLSVAPDETVDRALQMMTEHDVAHLVVVEPGSDRPVGVISTLDIAGLLAWGRA